MRAEVDFVHHSGEEVRSRDWDARIAVLAGRQHGVVSRGQLLAFGMGRGAIDVRIGRGGCTRCTVAFTPSAIEP